MQQQQTQKGNYHERVRQELYVGSQEGRADILSETTSYLRRKRLQHKSEEYFKAENILSTYRLMIGVGKVKRGYSV